MQQSMLCEAFNSSMSLYYCQEDGVLLYKTCRLVIDVDVDVDVDTVRGLQWLDVVVLDVVVLNVVVYQNIDQTTFLKYLAMIYLRHVWGHWKCSNQCRARPSMA